MRSHLKKHLINSNAERIEKLKQDNADLLQQISDLRKIQEQSKAGGNDAGPEESSSTEDYDPSTDPRWKRLTSDIASSMSVINAIDTGHPSGAGYDRALFVSSITGKISRLAKDPTNKNFVYAILDFIKNGQKDWKKPAITARNGIWKLFDYDKRPAPGAESADENEDIYVGLRWDDGRDFREIRGKYEEGVHAGKYGVRMRDDDNYVSILSAEDIRKMKAIDAENKIWRARNEEQARIQREREAAKKAEYENTQGFADQMNPMARAKAIKSLNQKVRHRGVVSTRKQYIERLVDEGYVVESERTHDRKAKEKAEEKLAYLRLKGIPFNENHPDAIEAKELKERIANNDFWKEERILKSPDESFFLEKDITKTATDYADYLIKKKESREGNEEVVEKIEATEESETPEAVTTLQNIVDGKYDNATSDDVQNMLEKCLGELETMGIAEQHDALLGKAAEKYVELMDKEGL